MPRKPTGVLYSKSKSGLKGVYERKGRWEARIRHKGTLIALGTYPTKGEAVMAVNAKCIELGLM
jgi:hypothetical protein